MQYILAFFPSTGFRWLAFYALVLAAWGALFAMNFSSTELAFVRIYGAEFWATLCAVDAHGAGFGSVLSMWLLMSAAMMAPTFVPSLRSFDDLTHTDAANKTGFYQLIAGYLLVWAGFSVLTAAAQLGLSKMGWIAGSRSVSDGLDAVLLIGAGAYQFTSLKEACLSKCRAPMTFFMQYWGENPAKMGLRLGLVCLGCCWALMLLGFVGGTMNLLWMGAATLLMVFEKLPQIGQVLSRPLGFALIAGGVVFATRSFI